MISLIFFLTPPWISPRLITGTKVFLNDYVQGTSLIHFSDFTTAPQLPTSTMTIREPCITHMAPHVHHHSTTFEYDTANHHCH